MRSVTTNPPTRLAVARTTASNATASTHGSEACPATMIAPTRMMPWMALAPDIKGVCSVLETLETTSKPTNTAKTVMVSRRDAVHQETPSLAS